MNLYAFLCGLIGICLTSTAAGFTFTNNGPSFDYFVLSLQWPESTAIRYSDDHKIVIHKNVTTWSVHGLWPSNKRGDGPFNCNTSWHFNMEEINPILGKMLKYWPNLFDDGKNDLSAFWSHEWNKHGTCAASVPKVRGERLYFGGAMDLLLKFSPDNGLKKSGIVPSDTNTYDYDDIEKAFEAYLQKKAHLQCFFKNKEKGIGKEHHQYLGQAFVCLDLNLTVIDCPQKNEESTLYFESLRAPPLVTCQEMYPVMIPTIKYTFSDRIRYL